MSGSGSGTGSGTGTLVVLHILVTSASKALYTVPHRIGRIMND